MNPLKKILSVIIILAIIFFPLTAIANINNRNDIIIESPLHNKEVCSFSRHAKILTAGIAGLFRGLKFEHNAENRQTTKLCNGLISFVIKALGFVLPIVRLFFSFV